MRKWISVLLAAVIFCMVLAPLSVSAAEYTLPFALHSQAAFLMNIDTGTVIYRQNSDSRLPPASMTKIMTAIVVLENVRDLDGETATSTANNIMEVEGTSTIGLYIGETLSVRELLYGMLVQSGNDAANVLANYVGGGSVSAFVGMMNEKAAALGCEDTTFMNPHGLHAEGQYTTPEDIAVIFRYAMENPTFAEIIATTAHVLPETNKRVAQPLTPTNKMLVETSEYYYAFLLGGKTGFVDEVGRNFVSMAQKDGLTYLCAVMGAPAVDEDGKTLSERRNFEDTIALYDWAFSQFAIKELLAVTESVAEVPLLLCQEQDYMLVYPAGNFTALVPREVGSDSVHLDYILPDNLKAPVQQGDVVGTVTISLAGEELGEIDLLAASNARRNLWLYRIYWIKNFVKTSQFKIGVIIFCALLIVLLLWAIIRINTHRRRSIYEGGSRRSKNRYSHYRYK